MATTVSILYVQRLLEVAESLGASRSDLCRRADLDLPSSTQPDVRVPARRYLDLWVAAMDCLRVPELPLLVAKRMDTASFDAFGFAVITSGTFGEALQRTQRYLPFVTDMATWDIRVEDDEVTMALVHAEPSHPGQRFLDEFALHHLLLMGRRLTGDAMLRSEVDFQHTEPLKTTHLQTFFGGPIAFGRPRSEIRLPSAVLGLPLKKADDRQLTAFFDRYLESALSKAYPARNFVASVRSVLSESLGRGAYSLDDIARKLGIGARTLRRRLGEEGLAYQALLQATRQDLAERYLKERRLSLGEIAFALGYAEPTAFHRAFRQWTGMTPAVYRTSHFPDAMPSDPQSRGNGSPPTPSITGKWLSADPSIFGACR